MATAKTDPKISGEKIHLLLLSKVQADFEWNARHGLLDKEGKLVKDSGDESKNNLTDLIESIKVEGQDTPVIVRPVGKSGEKFALVAGFRRYLAIKAIAEEQGNKTPTIKAVVRDLSDLEARALNIRENAARDDLRGPDLAWSIHELALAYKAKGLKSSSVVIASSIGKNQGYVNRLMGIMEHGDAKVTKLWRDAPYQVPIAEMERIVAHDKGPRQMEAFEEVVKNRTGTGGSGAGGGRGKWLEAAKTKAEGLGAMLGRLAKAEVVDFDGLDFEDPDHVRLCLDKLKGDATEAQIKSVGKALAKAFNEAKNAKDPEPEAPKSTGKPKRGNASATAQA